MTTTEDRQCCNSTRQCQRYLRIRSHSKKKTRRLSIGWVGQRIELEWTDRGAPFREGGYRLMSIESSADDLRRLVGLFVVGMVPASILADKLQEDHPECEWAADFMREWESVKQQET